MRGWYQKEHGLFFIQQQKLDHSGAQFVSDAAPVL